MLSEAMGASVRMSMCECVEVPGCVYVSVSGVGAVCGLGELHGVKRLPGARAGAVSPGPCPAEGLGAEEHSIGRPLRGGLPCVRSQNVNSILNGETGEFSCYFQYIAVFKDVGDQTRPH